MPSEGTPALNACQRCGACCAHRRVDFAVDELDDEGAGGRVPAGLAERLNAHTARMRGTDWQRPRCAALQGRIGESVGCAIHEWRPAPCREFGLRAPHGIGDAACAEARRAHGLPPLPE